MSLGNWTFEKLLVGCDSLGRAGVPSRDEVEGVVRGRRRQRDGGRQNGDRIILEQLIEHGRLSCCTVYQEQREPLSIAEVDL